MLSSIANRSIVVRYRSDLNIAFEKLLVVPLNVEVLSSSNLSQTARAAKKSGQGKKCLGRRRYARHRRAYGLYAYRAISFDRRV